MQERPILFSGPMVRALLAGTKTQTRRILKSQPLSHSIRGPMVYSPVTLRRGEEVEGSPVFGVYDDTGEWGLKCPYGQPGDRLWVKEAFTMGEGVIYRQEWDDSQPSVTLKGLWKPSIFMPRALSRSTLEVTAIRVERLQDINRGDAMEEGCPFRNMAKGDDPRQWYSKLWDSINGPGSWEENPWVWVVEFRVVAPGGTPGGTGGTPVLPDAA